MTVGSKVNQTLTTLRWIDSTLRAYSTVSENEEEKKVFEKSMKVTEEVIADLQFRIKKLELEEPQYKGF